MKTQQQESVPWHRIPLVWLVIALPAAALIGSGIVLALTVLRPDVEVHSERLDAPSAEHVH
jgi:hypothetical protein